MQGLIIFALLCPLNSFRGRKQYEPPKYMTINTAIEQLLELEVEQNRGESGMVSEFLLSSSLQFHL
jgi:diphthamide biosynthesis methyltransferase